MQTTTCQNPNKIFFFFLFAAHFNSSDKLKAHWQATNELFFWHRLKDEWSKRRSAMLCSHLGQLNATYGPPEKSKVCISAKKFCSTCNYSVTMLFYREMIWDAVGDNPSCKRIECSTVMALHPVDFFWQTHPNKLLIYTLNKSLRTFCREELKDWRGLLYSEALFLQDVIDKVISSAEKVVKNQSGHHVLFLYNQNQFLSLNLETKTRHFKWWQRAAKKVWLLKGCFTLKLLHCYFFLVTPEGSVIFP